MKRTTIKHNRMSTGIVLLASALFMNILPARAEIHIGGDVYGGGKEGAVGTGNTTATATTAKDDVTLNTCTEAEATAENNKHLVPDGSGKNPGDTGYTPTYASNYTEVTAGTSKAAISTTEVIVYAGNVRTVFGGGMNGRVYGKTSVEISGGTIGGEEWDETIHGGVFGAGDGASALVFGHDEVTLKGGTIYNNVYGGGNQAEMIGSTTVDLRGGTIYGNLFGGARMADIQGRSFVNINGTNAINDLVVKAVYGGNDISGSINRYVPASGSSQWAWLSDSHYSVLPTNALARDAAGNIVITKEWNAFVYSTPSSTKTIFVGNLYGGGNGDYNYANKGTELSLPFHKNDAGEADQTYKEDANGNVIPSTAENYSSAPYQKTFTGLASPTVAKTYLQLEGGVFGYVYGGGNNATVTANTEIYINNTTSMTDPVTGLAVPVTIPATDAAKMGLQYGGQCPTYTVSGDDAEFKYQFDRVFGGNNKATMDIQPRWYLVQAKINNLYSGGNAGNMTNEDGILINIFQNADAATNGPDRVEVVNVYGGCRMADVIPTKEGKEVETTKKKYFTDSSYAYEFPAKYSARVYIAGGKISNVYGGNDISGSVHGGTDVEIHGAIAGDVYGGGNGSYAYTDNASLKNDPEWGDFYYAADGTLNGTAATDAASSLAGMYKKRPHIDNSLVHISGTSTNQVYVTGNVYCGGNSASLEEGKNATAKFQIGPYVTMNGVYLGSNGANMITQEMLRYYNNKIKYDFSMTDLANTTDKDGGLTHFDKYLKGVEVDVRPTIDWDENLNYTTQIGAFVCGGNVGSMAAPGTFTLNLPKDLVIFDRLVGGCNAANVAPVMDTDNKTALNPFHLGGVTVAPDEGQPKLILNANARLQPRWLDYSIDPNTHFLTSTRPLAYNWNTELVTTETSTVAKDKRIFKGANIYGGCYTSGYVNGDVEINISENIISPEITNIGVAQKSYQIDANNETEASRTATVEGLRTQRDYIFASTMAAYGGGYGADTEIWGDVTINLSENAGILKVYGGGEQGIIGHIARNDDGQYLNEDEEVFVAGAGKKYKVVEPPCNAVVNLVANMTKPTGEDLFNVGRVYGGGFQGVVTGNTALYLGGGKVSEAIAGAANADIYGYTEMFIGKDLAGQYDNDNPFTAAREFDKAGNVYGGNDFGGKIWGAGQHTVAAVSGGMTEKKVTSNTYVEYQRGLIGNSVYGGACGSYNYGNDAYTAAKAVAGFVKPTLLETVTAGTGDTYTANTFVNVASSEASRDVAFVGYPVYNNENTKTGDHGAFFGGGKGYLDLEGIVDVDKTYVLLHAATSRTNNEFLTPDIYGGGYYSLVKNTMVDAYTGNFNFIYGGTFGATADQKADTHLTNANYQNETTTINTYPSFTTNPNITIYGSGGYVGTKTTNVNLFGGMLGNVYGGSFNEGVCNVTNVNVMNATEGASGWQYAGTFAGSTVNVKALFGGSQGSADALPCDVLQSNVKFHSEQAYVRGEDNEDEAYIYGGNHDYRATEHTLVEITVPVRMSSGGNLVNVCGAGFGRPTVAGFTHVDLKDGALVNNVYGGGRDGKVLNQYDILTTSDPDDDASGYFPYDALTGGDKRTSDNIQTYAYWTTPANTPNTLIDLAANSTVRGSMFGAGFGADATVAGTTQINSYGTVDNYIYGGGFAGDVREMASTDLGYVSAAAHSTAGTIVNVLGGNAQKVYGGGSKGDVGALVGGNYDNATTQVNIGSKTGTTYANGVPTILLSAYGGGEMGKVYGTASVTMNNGYIGYEYRTATSEEITAINAEHAGDAGWTALTDGAKWYFPNLKADADDTDNKLYQYGNLYGAGFGEGAVTLNTDVQIYGGTVRNGLYGGGEVAAVGFATLDEGKTSYTTEDIVKPGFAKVTMYEGNVGGSVFGGGRGYSYTVEEGVGQGTKYYSDGYTFGKTEVNIHGGTIGTDESLAMGEGNVFGGGNIGYVYSGSGTKNSTNGYYYNGGNLTEDCKVVISPYCRVTEAVKIGDTDYAVGEYVPVEALNTITLGDDSRWNQLDQTGIIIRNAVFAGGNVTQGSDIMYIEATTVFGNVTASVVDLFAKDLVTLGNDDVGGLYGDGNLTFVDGYRELNISNYGTDYYGLSNEITYDDYKKLNNRQRAYFNVQYKCTDAYSTYNVGDKIDEETYNGLLAENEDVKNYWEPSGFCSVYAGRMMNTIQRADFCGVFGSRMVLKGAQDRVPAVVDYTKYTINRVGEVSLNQVDTHGNYFGMYNVVNYLGALSSDVAFTDTRKTQSATHLADGKTYYGFKYDNRDKSYRNNGESANIVALASGVFLELVKEPEDGASSETKDYGPITGIIQLDLISVKTGEGGGYVYAKNEHGTLKSSEAGGQTTLTAANTGAVSYKQFTYNTATSGDNMQTSGNFVHSTKRIVDSCFPKGGIEAPAHYWYIKGDYYVYDQYISAYTGSSNSYAETISLPLAIQAAANGKLTLENIQTGRYTYFTTDKDNNTVIPNQNEVQQIEINNMVYGQNEPISYWDWNQLPLTDQNKFLVDTYVCVQDFTVGGTTYKEGQVFTAKPAVSDNYVCMYGFKVDDHQYSKGDVLSSTVYSALSDVDKANCVTAESLFHLTNGVNSTNGLVLAVSLDNPNVWDEYHTKKANPLTITDKKTYTATGFDKTGYLDSPAPTYMLTGTGDVVYAQNKYNAGTFISEATYTSYETGIKNKIAGSNGTQATFERAYIAKEACDYTYVDANNETQTQHVVKGGAIPASVYTAHSDIQSNFELGYMCTSTVKLAEDKYLIMGETYGATEYASLVDECTAAGVTPANVLDEAYYCTAGGAYGGKVYTSGNNFDAVDYTALNATERADFSFNWDALDVLSKDQTWPTNMEYYDGWDGTSPNVDRLYSAPQSLNYTATYNGEAGVELPMQGGGTIIIPANKELTNVQYESLLNEKANYVYLDPDNANTYTVNAGKTVTIGTVTYQAGETILGTAYNNLPEADKANVTKTSNKYYYITKAQVSAGPILYDANRILTKEEYDKVIKAQAGSASLIDNVPVSNAGKYYCIKDYGSISRGTIIEKSGSESGVIYYDNLKNAQMDFTISGETPVEKSVLYVTKDINPFDVTQDRIITVIYQYKYTEADESGTSFENILERHVLNIHVHFESGVPSIGELAKPATILPGSTVGLNTPVVTPGAFEVIGGGFEVFENKTDAESQQNGVDWENFRTPMYWYQNDWYVAYYAETYLGKTYSNAVPFTVANYHTLDKVMGDKAHHYYVDNPNVQRNSKIYLDNHECTSDATKSELDLLKDFYDLSLATTETTDGHQPLDEHVKGGEDLEFILNSDVAPKAYTDWTPIGDAAQCFKGNLHGNGYTVTGLNNSLFGNLCGNVYNLGVTGAINGSGIAETGGYAENCWLINDAAIDLSGKHAIMGKGVMENCYYNDDAATVDYGTTVSAIYKPMTSFLNGEAAYNLNRFYLRKRYADANTTSGNDYKYFTIDPLDNTKLVMMDGSDTNKPLGHYPNDFTDSQYDKKDASGNVVERTGYVEHYYMDGDYIYAKGTIPEKDNERYVKTDLKHYPIYPDDYIFFGQKLTYNTSTHNNTPTAIKKTVTKDTDGTEHERIVRNNTATENRVYRAPAYFGSKTQSKAYYNRSAAFVDQYTPAGSSTAVDIYKGMTAIDFTGADDPVADHVTSTGADDKTYAENQDKFYAPLLDYEGLSAFKTSGITQNLLVYAPTEDSEAGFTVGTHDVLVSALPEPSWTASLKGDGYGSVKTAEGVSSVKGHLVNYVAPTSAGSTGSYVANGIHYLVDKQDFNCPIAYAYTDATSDADDTFMWYQRKPAHYATADPDGNHDAWETLVLPFTATTVTTTDKGEVTHFYGSDYKGHEYWLREFNSVTTDNTKSPAETTAVFNRPAAGTENNEVENTFLWDYYYSEVAQKDKNGDTYQEYYSDDTRTYEDYGFLTEGVPYIISFPGKRYYEFDMSGTFLPQNTATHTWSTLPAQTITYVSAPGATMRVTDDLTTMTVKKTANSNYTFKGTFLNKAATDTPAHYAINAAGTAFSSNGEGTSAYVPFRAYFDVPTAASGSAPKRILIGNNDKDEDEEPMDDILTRGLTIKGGRECIVIESTLEYEATVIITTAGGQLIQRVTIQPEGSETVPVNSRGIYLANRQKVAVM